MSGATLLEIGDTTMWLKQLATRLAALDLEGAVGPDAKVEEGERVLGTASDEVKRLWVLGDALGKESREKTAVMLTAHIVEEKHDHAVCNSKREELLWIAEEGGMVNNLLWMTVKAELGLRRGSVAIRENWQITTQAEDDQD